MALLQNSGIVIQLADCSLAQPLGVVTDIIVNVDGFLFPVDFYVLNVNEHSFSSWNSVFLGSPFLKTAKAQIDVGEGLISIVCNGRSKNFSMYDDDAFTNPFLSSETSPLQDCVKHVL